MSSTKHFITTEFCFFFCNKFRKWVKNETVNTLIDIFSLCNSIIPHKLLTNGPTRGSRPKIYTDSYKAKTQQINVKHTTTETRLPPMKSQRLTGLLLADKVIPWRLKLQELFFLFPKRSCSCFAREVGGKGGLQHLHSWSVGQRKQSLPRRGRHWTAAENNDVGHK